MTFQLDLGQDAEADIDNILEWSVFRFGAAIRDSYQALMMATFASIARNPELLGSHDRRDLGHGLRTLHLRACHDEVSPAVRRIANPRHFVVYRQAGEVVQVVRLLHEAMNVSARNLRG